MHADVERGRQVAQHAVGHRDIGVDQARPAVAARRERGLHVRVAELGEGGLVDLHIGAAGRRERLELGAEGRDRVVPEFLDVVIGMRRDGGVAAAEMQRAGTGNRELRHRAGEGAQALEIVGMDRLRPCELALDHRGRLGAARERSAGLATDRVGRDVAEAAVEIAVVGAAAKLAVGREPQPDPRLQIDRRGDRLVLASLQLLAADLAALISAPRVEQRRRAQQAADMLGAERRPQGRHRASHCGTRLSASARAAGLVPVWTRPELSDEKA